MKELLGITTVLMDKVVRRGRFGQEQRLRADQIPHNTLHARLKAKETKDINTTTDSLDR